MNIVIRKAGKFDIKDISELEKLWLTEGVSWGLIPTKKKELAKEIKKLIYQVVEIDSKIVGFISAEIKKSDGNRPALGIKKGEYFGEIHSLYIKKEFRGKGIGKLLVKKVFEIFKKSKIKIIKLKAVNKDLKKLVNFYKKFGFKERTINMILKWR